MDSFLNSLLQCWIFVMISIQVVLTEERITSEYFTAFINISYYDHNHGVLHTERTETGRFSSNPAKEVSGVIVELLSNITNPSDNATHIIDRSACQGPFLRNWPADQSWIALIKRGNCTFNTKIANALGLKASGVLIYDHLDSGQVLHNIKIDPFSIPSVFTYYWKGQELSRLIQTYGSVEVKLEKGSHCQAISRGSGPFANFNQTEGVFCTPEDTWRWREFQLLLQRQSPFWNWNLTSIHSSYDFSEKRTSVLFVSVSFIVLMLISLAWLVFYYVQRFRYIHAKDRMERKLSCQAKRALAIIPTIGITQEEGDEDGNMDTCAVCIETYRIGETVRILPCNHRFHKNCIDQWLLARRTCPMCKMDILKHYGLIHEEETSVEDREETMFNIA